MSRSFRAVRQLFERALDLPEASRAAWLRAETEGDDELRAEVERLLEIDAKTSPVLDRSATADLPPEADGTWVGRRIGSFVLKAVLGRGGMGTVFEAEQERPHRRVALKVMRRALGDGDTRSRFTYEAEILARLQHPGIAQVYEAATFEVDGIEQPYFAMERIENALPLDEFARAHELDTDARLRLFEKVCEAVHHGHQRGVVHRDLKPANIPVDEQGQPKLIDFGIARAGGSEWQATLSSGSDGAIGTLAYMAPEQLDLGGQAIDTRVDVYALGVILFQLVTGELPLDVSDLPLGQATDVIRNAEPPLVSTRAAAVRLPRDLDWIASKAMRKDPDARYPSAEALCDDIERLRRGEPVLAGPPTVGYRIRKFVGRNRVAVFAAAAVAVALLAGTIAASIGWHRALEAEALAESRRAEAERNAEELWQVTQLQFDLLGSARGDKNILLGDVIDAWSRRLPGAKLSDRVSATLHAALATSFQGLGHNDRALAEFERAFDRIGERASAMPRASRIVRAGYARLLSAIGKSEKAEPILREVLAELEASPNANAYEAAVVRTTLGSVLLERRRFDECHELYAAALPVIEKEFGEGHYRAITVRRGLGLALQNLGRTDEARKTFERTVVLARSNLGEKDPETLSARNTFAVFLFHQGEIEAALAQFTELHGLDVQVLGPAHPQTLRCASNRALCFERMKRFAEAAAIYREVLAARAEAGAPTELTDLITRFNLVVALHNQDDPSSRREALTRSDALIADAGELLPENNWRLAVFRQHRGIVLRKLGRFAEAEKALDRARAVLEKTLGLDDGRTRSNYAEMARLYAAWGRPEEAARWRAKLPSGR